MNTMQYQVVDSRYYENKDINVLFATNEKQEAVQAADEIGSGIVVIRLDRDTEPNIVYISAYKSNLALSE